MRITKVSKTHFETEDGESFPIDPPLEQEMTTEEFQEHYDKANNFIKSIGYAGSDNENS